MGILAFILILLVLNAVVCLVLTNFIRSTGLAMVASIIISIMLFLVWGMNSAANAKAEDVHDVFLAINIMMMFVAPAVMGTSVGFVLLIRRAQEKSQAAEKTESEPGFDHNKPAQDSSSSRRDEGEC